MAKKKILYLEDGASDMYFVVQVLKKDPAICSNYDIIACSRLDIAKDEFNKNKGHIALIVTDLNMSDDFINKELKQETYGCMLTGWVWLEHYVLADNPNLPIIIYSAFIDVLKKEKSQQIRDRNICFLGKGIDIDEDAYECDDENENHGFEALLCKVKKILNI